MDGHLLYLSAPDCHLCERGRGIVETLAREAGLGVVELRWSEARAEELTERDQVPFPPALYLDEQLLGYGRLSARRLRRALAQVPA